MKRLTIPILSILALFGSATAGELAPSPVHEDHAHDEPLHGSVFFEPFEHLHFSALGTPILHSFNVEPAFTGRDLFGTYRYRSGDGFDEHEIETEVEWAFTRRLGIIFEVPYIFENADDEGKADGFGDLAIVPRALLIEGDKFLLTTQVEIVAPTGTNGLGGETAIAPGLAIWSDLGNWWTLNTNLAVEHIFDEDATEFLFGFGLVKSFGERPDLSPDAAHDHLCTAGIFNLLFEVTGVVGLNGEDEGVFTAEGLVGFSYGVNHYMDFRIGYEFPMSTPRDFDSGLATGFVWHF